MTFSKILVSLAIVAYSGLDVSGQTLCLDLFGSKSFELPFQQMRDFDHADPHFVKGSQFVQRLLVEKSRAESSQNWTAEQIQEVQSLFPENPAMAKSVYRAIIDRLIDYEAADVVYLTDEFLSKKFNAEINNETSHKLLGVAPKRDFRWRGLLLGVLVVHGNLNLSLWQYGRLSQLNEIIKANKGLVSAADLKAQLLPILKATFPGSVISTDRGAMQMLAYTESGKSCCGHGCSGCFSYVVTTGLSKMGDIKNSTLPLVSIVHDRNNAP